MKERADRLPVDPEAESNIIGSVLIDPHCLSEVGAAVRPSDFYDDSLRTIYQAMLSIDARDEAVDQVTVGSELAAMKMLDKVGGRARLSGLIAQCVTSVNAPQYAIAVKRCSLQRQLISAAADIAGKAYTAGSNIEAVIRECQDMLLRLSSKQAVQAILNPGMVADMAEQMYSERRLGVDHEVMPYGFIEMDRRTGGAHKGDFIILAGHTGMGKSALAQGWTRNIGKTQKCLYFSTEMSMPQLIDREMAVILDCPTDVLTAGRYDDVLFGEIIKGCAEIQERNIYYFNSAMVTTSDIHWAATQMKQEYGLDFVVVDYLQQLADEYGRNQTERMGYMTRRLKNMAISLDIAVVGVSQFNRESEKMDDKRPKRWQLRDSGSLEQDADVLIFLYRDDYYYTPDAWDMKYKGKKPYPKNVVEVLIEKQRQREAPVMHYLTWDGRTMQHRNYASPDEEEQAFGFGG